MARGGRRQGRAGANYQQRSDLQLGQRLPVQAAPGQAYGVRGQLEDQQRQVPLLSAVPPGGQVPAGGGATSPAPPPPPGPLDAPTAMPDEPLTAGSAYGAGPGPTAVGLGSPDLRTEDVAAMKRYLPALEAMASQPNASPATRTFVRRLRAAMPVEG